MIVAAALIGAIVWNLITWYFGLPSSSSHALIGGLVGSALASASVVHWDGVVEKVVIPMVLSPVIGFSLAAAIMIAIYWIFRNGQPGKTNRGFRYAQTVSAAAMALGHGLQDAQKTMGVIFLALTVGGFAQPSDPIPQWVILSAAGAISLGTYAGGWRIMRTLGRRIIALDPPQGFAAESAAATVLYGAAIGFGAPISTTHTITTAIMGVGGHQAAQRGAVGRRGQHRDRVDPHHPGRGHRGRRVLLRPARHRGGLTPGKTPTAGGAYMTSTS
ncbi:inorganic phosphate transporter [Nonomuraea salmonea]|uniref:inorganic phosphate transporter n=1 Tax=Nonomuraea salmonea TaxID=46181 RepID=UPI002FEB2BAD